MSKTDEKRSSNVGKTRDHKARCVSRPTTYPDNAPAWESAAIYDRALREAGNRDVTLAIFPQGNHRIRTEETGAFCAGYLALLGDWVARRVALEWNR